MHIYIYIYIYIYSSRDSSKAPTFILSSAPRQCRCLVVLYANSCLKTSAAFKGVAEAVGGPFHPCNFWPSTAAVAVGMASHFLCQARQSLSMPGQTMVVSCPYV